MVDRITGFDPIIQGDDARFDNLVVIGSVDFSSNSELWEAFVTKHYDFDEWCFDEETKTAYYKW